MKFQGNGSLLIVIGRAMPLPHQSYKIADLKKQVLLLPD